MRFAAGLSLLALSLGMLALPAEPALAEMTTKSVEFVCGFQGPEWNPDSAWTAGAIINHPTSVSPGESFEVSFDANPMKNGPIASGAASFKIRARVTVGGSSPDAGGHLSGFWENSTAIASNTTYDIPPLPLTLTAGDSGSVDVSFDGFQLEIYLLPDSILKCLMFEGGSVTTHGVTIPITEPEPTTTTTTTTEPLGDELVAPASFEAGSEITLRGKGFTPDEAVEAALSSGPIVLGEGNADSSGIASLTVTVPPDTAPGDDTLALVGLESGYRLEKPVEVLAAQPTTTTTTPPTTSSSSTTTTAPTTTSSSSTTTAPTSTTTTTIPTADQISATKTVSYACTPVVSGSSLGTETAAQSVTISAPDRVNTGDQFAIAIKMSPGPENGPIPLDPGTVDPQAVVVVTNASPSSLRMGGSTNSSAIAPQAPIPVPSMRGNITATGAVGDSITYTPSTFTFNSPLLNAVTTCEPTSAVAVLSTRIVEEEVNVSGAAGQSTLAATGLEEPETKLWVSLGLLYLGFLFITTLPRGYRLPGAWGKRA